MTCHTLLAIGDMFFMQILTVAPGFGAVAVVAQIAFHFYKTRGFTCMTAGTCNFASSIECMFGMHSLICHGLC